MMRTSSYKGILSGYSWNSEPTLTIQPTPIFLTYSFPASDWDTKAFNSKDKAIARYALKQWGNASGIHFLETKSGEADIKFVWEYNWSDTLVAWADFPELWTSSNEDASDILERVFDAGTVHLNLSRKSELANNKSYKTFVLLHEIGHALGLKHPFHKMPYNKVLLSKSLDNTKYTVMSYTNDSTEVYPTKLGRLDKQAIKALYGFSSADNTHVSSWGWDAWTETLTQVGKADGDRIHGTAVQDVILGMEGNDRLFGYDGDDTLSGGPGNDTLAGGFGNNTFVFDTALNPETNVDKLAGLNGHDTIRLSQVVFTALPKGMLSSSQFSTDGMAHDADDRILYDSASGRLYYDADGTGTAEKMLFAKITKLWIYDTFELAASNFYVV